MAKEKEITIDDLALMVQKGFEGMDKRFEGMDKRFDEVKDHLTRIENISIRGMTNRIERLEDRTQIIETAIRTSGVR